MNILIADDDKSSRELISELLRGNNHRVYSVDTAIAALDSLKHGVPDLIVSDILMPGMDGFEFCRRVRSDDKLKNIPFVLLSGAFLDKKDSEFAKSIGVTNFLSKPIEPTEFLQAVEALLLPRKKSINRKPTKKENARAAEDQAKLVTEKLYKKVLELDEEKALSREMENQLRSISDSLPEHLAEIDTKYNYVFANEIYAQSYHTTQELIAGKNVQEVIGECTYNIIKPILEAAMAGDENSSKLRLPLGDGGKKRHVMARFIPRKNPDGKTISIVTLYSDITHLHEVESALDENELMLKSVLSSAPIILIAIDKNGIILISEGKNLFEIGYKSGQIVGKSVFDVFRGTTGVLENVKRALMGEQFETTISLSERFLRVSYTPQFDSEKNFVGTVSVAVDETTNHRLEKEIMQISEVEQERIGNDLHDALGQTLTGVNLLSQALQKKLSSKLLPEADDARKIGGLAAYATEIAKEAIRGLSPVSRMESGLFLALEELTRVTEELYKIPCSFLYDREFQLANHQTETQLYRILQEAINNAVKHADPKRIDISYRTDGKAHLFIVQDTSNKPRNNRIEKDKGMGLNIMHYRSNMIGASLNIETGASGTCVTCSIPEI